MKLYNKFVLNYNSIQIVKYGGCVIGNSNGLTTTWLPCLHCLVVDGRLGGGGPIKKFLACTAKWIYGCGSYHIIRARNCEQLVAIGD